MPYLNPIFLMAHSGARGGVEQIRQLAGMRGLMAKPSGQIIETPIKANFREGLSVLEYFSSTHGARKGLADTALKTADSGYLTRKLADVAQNVVITMHDCGTHAGHHQGRHLQGRGNRTQPERIDPRPRQPQSITTITGEVIVEENEMITWEQARKIEQLGIDKVVVRSPMTCQAAAGRLPAVLRHGPGHRQRWSKKAWPSASSPPSRSASPARSSPCVPSTSAAWPSARSRRAKSRPRRPARQAGPHHRRHQRPGRFRRPHPQRPDPPHGRQGPHPRRIRRPQRCRPLRQGRPDGSARPTILVKWDPHRMPILAERGGRIRFEDIVEGETLRKERDATGAERWVIMEHKGDLHPQIVIEDERGQKPGSALHPGKGPPGSARRPAGRRRHAAGQDAARSRRHAGHHRRSAARHRNLRGPPPARPGRHGRDRRPRPPRRKRKGKRSIIVEAIDDNGKPTGQEREHLVPHGKHLRVHTGDYVKEGDPLVDGPLVPHDILRISGIEAVQNYLVREVQSVYRSQRVDIDDKHIEIIISQMLRKVKVETMGDTGLLPGSVIDKFAFREVNDRLQGVREDQGPRRLEVRAGQDRQQGSVRGGARRPGSRGQEAADLDPDAGDVQHAASGHHQGGGAVRQLHLGGQLPGNDQGADRGGPGRQGRLPGRPEGERDPGPPDPGRHRLPVAPGSRGPHQRFLSRFIPPGFHL